MDGFIQPESKMVEKAQKEVENMMRGGRSGSSGWHSCGIHPELVKLLGKMKFGQVTVEMH